jgi:hypothetical protein
MLAALPQREVQLKSLPRAWDPTSQANRPRSLQAQNELIYIPNIATEDRDSASINRARLRSRALGGSGLWLLRSPEMSVSARKFA